MPKHDVHQKELDKLREIFQSIEPDKARLVESLIEDAAFLAAENYVLRECMKTTGMIKIHPEFPEVQKPTEAAKQYLKNINSYAVVVKTLNSILQKNAVEGDDEFDDFMKETKG